MPKMHPRFIWTRITIICYFPSTARRVTNYFFGICVAQLVSLFVIFSFEDGLKTMILSEKSDTPYRAFKRYLSTVVRLNNWYVEDPWDQETQAHRNVQKVRKMHLAMRRRLRSYDYEQIDASSRIPEVCCPLQGIIVKDFKDTCPMANDLQCPFTMTRTKKQSQGDMSCTQSAFMSMMVLYPKKFGVHNVCNEDLEAFCHMWRGLGYLLGIEDQYNFCCGGLQEVRERIKNCIEFWLKPYLRSVTPEWEHMSLCLYRSMYTFVPVQNYKTHLLYICDIFELNMPRLYRSMSLVEKMMYSWMHFQFGYLTRLPLVHAFFSTILF
ncbi:PREDICTED: uncharacterized protein LOC106743576 [Dinoponera quadriceps]|uniref:Uncharacterized protein LOC106743576 n=1 Tax=Dinoponera quadriceps TaxID=609295 RepID=A0A6P3X562_DINQU|nr:PREDICTED: uncharacterized protein LOC106743576 [Dinoponera quadriceps]